MRFSTSARIFLAWPVVAFAHSPLIRSHSLEPSTVAVELSADGGAAFSRSGILNQHLQGRSWANAANVTTQTIIPSMVVTIQSRLGKLCADKGTSGIVCESDEVGPNEKFQVAPLPNGRIGLKGTFMSPSKFCVETGTGVRCLRASEEAAGRFLIFIRGDRLLMRNDQDKKWCTAHLNRNNQHVLQCTAAQPGHLARFVVRCYQNCEGQGQTTALQDGMIVSLNSGRDNQMCASSASGISCGHRSVHVAQMFTVQVAATGKGFQLKGTTGTYSVQVDGDRVALHQAGLWCLDNNGTVLCNSKSINSWGRFAVYCARNCQTPSLVEDDASSSFTETSATRQDDAVLAAARQWVQNSGSTWSDANAARIQSWLGLDFIQNPAWGTSHYWAKERLGRLNSIIGSGNQRFAILRQGTLIGVYCKNGTLAFAIPQGAAADWYQCTLYFCSALDQITNTSLKALVLLHEALHCTGTLDLAYSWNASLTTLPASEKRENGHSYLGFLMETNQIPLKPVSLQRVQPPPFSCTRFRSPSSTVCSSSGRVCKVLVKNAGLNCKSYCEVQSMFARSAYNAWELDKTCDSPEIWESAWVTEQTPPAPLMVCWCTTMGLASFAVDTATTTTAKTVSIR